MHNQILTTRPRAVITTAGRTMLCTVRAVIAKICQGIDTGLRLQIDAGAESAITAIRTSEWNEFFATEADGARPTISTLNFNDRFVDEFHETQPVLRCCKKLSVIITRHA